MKTPSHSSSPESRHQESDDSPALIFVAEDEPTIRLGIEYSLMTVGFEVETAEDGDAAIARLVESPESDLPDAAILDLRMPGADGMTVVRKLTAAGRQIPIAIASAYIDSPTAVEAIDLGVVDFLKKPVTPNEIRGAITKILGEEQAHAPVSDSPDVNTLENSQPVTVNTALAKARCLLRRRRREEAISLLKETDLERGSDASLWLTLAEHLQACHEGQNEDFPALASSAFYNAANLLDFITYQEN